MYLWRQMTEIQREDARRYRRTCHFPKHSPPHFEVSGRGTFLVTAACYEHAHVIGENPTRMSDFESDLLSACEQFGAEIFAWCLLPNHYHVLLKTADIKALPKELGLVHGRSSYEWNREDGTRGRQVWHNCFERKIRGGGHFMATFNYVLHNAVHHGYVDRWQDWEWSNAKNYLAEVGDAQAKVNWLRYPIRNYGKKWDIY